MFRRNLRVSAVVVCFVAVSCSDEPAPKDRVNDSKILVSDSKLIEGIWLGSWGGGHRGDEGIFLPAVAELFIQGDHVELRGFRNLDNLTGSVRLDAKAKQMHITPTANPGGQPAPKAVDYAYELKGDKLTLTASDKFAIAMQKLPSAQNPLANAQVDLVTATGINAAGDLLVTEFTELHVG